MAKIFVYGFIILIGLMFSAVALFLSNTEVNEEGLFEPTSKEESYLPIKMVNEIIILLNP